jgi:hypothetical protein
MVVEEDREESSMSK